MKNTNIFLIVLLTICLVSGASAYSAPNRNITTPGTPILVYPSIFGSVYSQNQTRTCSWPLTADYMRTSGYSTICAGSVPSNQTVMYLAFYNITPYTSVVLNCSRQTGDNIDWSNVYLWRFYSGNLEAEGALTWANQPLSCSVDTGMCSGGYGGLPPTQSGNARFWNLTALGLYGYALDDLRNLKFAIVAYNPMHDKVAYIVDGFTTPTDTCKLMLGGTVMNLSSVSVSTYLNGALAPSVYVNVSYLNGSLYFMKASNASGIAGMSLPFGTYTMTSSFSDAGLIFGSEPETVVIDSPFESLSLYIIAGGPSQDTVTLEGLVYYNGAGIANATVTLINGSDAERYGYTNASGYYSIPNLRTCEYNGFASYNGLDGPTEGISLMGEIVDGKVEHDFYIDNIGFDSVLNISVYDSGSGAAIENALVYDYWCPTLENPEGYYYEYGLEGCVLNHYGSTNASGRKIFPEYFYNIGADGVAYTLVIVLKEGYEPVINGLVIANGHTDVSYYMTGPGGAPAGYNITYNVTGFYGESIAGAFVSTDAYISGMHPHVEGVTLGTVFLTLRYASKPTALTVATSKYPDYDPDYFLVSSASAVRNWYNIRLYPSQGEYNATDTFEIGGYAQLGVNPLSGVSVVAQCDLYFGASQRYESDTGDDGFYSFTIPEAMCLIYPASTVSYGFTPSEYANFDTALGDNETLNFTVSINPNQRYSVVAHAYTRSGAIFTSPLEGVEVYVQCLNDSGFRPESGVTDQNGETSFNLYSGEYNFTFTKSGFLVINNYYTVTRTQTGPVEVEMRTGADKGSASVTLFRKVGDVSESESGVFALKDSNGDIVWTTTTPTHTYLFSNLAPGRYSVGAIGTRGGTAAVSFNVEAGKTTTITMTIDDLIARLNDAWESFLNVVILLMGGMGFILLLVFFAVISVLIGVITRGK